jgi:hypothetical protein
VFNTGSSDLIIFDIERTAGSEEITLDENPDLPLSIGAGSHVDFNLRCDGLTAGAKSATFQIWSNDADEPMIDLVFNCNTPEPNLNLSMADSGDFGEVCPLSHADLDGSLGCYTERTTTVRNTGDCPLTIESISAADDFTVMTPSVFPIVLPSGEETLDVTVRFAPLSAGDPLASDEFLGLLSIVSDDPDAAGEADLCGEGVAQSGVRVLATEISTGLPLPVEGVDNITLKSKGKKTPSPINLQFTDVPVQITSVCENTVTWHVDQETLPSAGTTGSNPKSSYQVSAREGNLQSSQSFNLGQCDFFEFQLQLLDSGSEDCTLLGKGEACTTAGECCSGKCKGPDGGKTCK